MAPDRLRRILSHPLARGGLALLVLVIVADRSADWAYSGNREAVIQIMGQLRKGMPRADVERILSEYESRFSVKHLSPEGLVWWTQTGLVTAWSVSLTFSGDGRLNMARTSTEDGPYHPKGVPPDIR
jgi:hypothetical protein